MNHDTRDGPWPTDALGVQLLTRRQRILLAAISLAVTFTLWWLASASGWVDRILLP